ncbi:hypothetical protein QVD17_28546 [Tagetes erecta]|uniref:Uncharacterized protein n=1 Tax=Tagetes erecta TaxID=13708 RepID=A0AAD8KAR6_TARER|nr:hypothetical protein QVD17_28546 [Tagetes erecta]
MLLLTANEPYMTDSLSIKEHNSFAGYLNLTLSLTHRFEDILHRFLKYSFKSFCYIRKHHLFIKNISWCIMYASYEPGAQVARRQKGISIQEPTATK